MKRTIALLLAILLLGSFVTMAFAASEWYCPKCGRKNTDNFCPKDGTARPADIGGTVGNSSSSVRSRLRVGDVVRMGVYEQDNSFSNGKETIEWIVLSVSGDAVLVISRYGLEAQQPYNDHYGTTTWENCTLRKWLNDDFYRTAFTYSEQSSIVETYVDNGISQNNTEWDTSGGRNTYDKIFLLSCAEAKRYFSNNAARRCGATDYAIEQGAWTYDQYSPENRLSGVWWLRSPGPSQYYAACVDIPGGTKYYNSVGNGQVLVRPAMWIAIDNAA